MSKKNDDKKTTADTKPKCTGAVEITVAGLGAKSAKAVGEGLGAEEVNKQGKAFLAEFPIDTALIKASKEDGICSYGAEFGGLRANVESAEIKLVDCEPGMLEVLDRLVGRSSHHLAKIGVNFLIDTDENEVTIDCDQDVAELEAGVDLAVMQTTVAVLLVARAYKALSYTGHPLTFYDFSQAIGLVQGVKNEMEGAVTISGMITPVLKTKPKPKKKKASGKDGVKPGKKPKPTGKPKKVPKKPAEDETDDGTDGDEVDSGGDEDTPTEE